MNVALDALEFVLLPGGVPAEEWRPHYRAAYELWEKVWSETFAELDGTTRLFSDEFTRQSFVAAIFERDQCRTLGLFHRVDFSLPTARADSYFKVWPDEAVAKLIAEGPLVYVGSNITVDANYRGDVGQGLQLKNLLIALMVKTFLHSDYDALTGTMRVNKNMHRAAQRFGGVPLAAGILHHGVEVELLAFYRRSLAQTAHLLPDLGAERLWRARRDFRAGAHPTSIPLTGENP